MSDQSIVTISVLKMGKRKQRMSNGKSETYFLFTVSNRKSTNNILKKKPCMDNFA